MTRNIFISLLIGIVCSTACPAAEAPVEVLVIGRQPGMLLWKVTNGERVLWILPLVSAVPRDMIWEDKKVAGGIAGADEAIGTPGVSIGISKRALLNPVNWFRGSRLFKRLNRNAGGATLDERYAALKLTYFPEQHDIDQLRPAFAAGVVADLVLQHEKPTSSQDIARHVEKLISRNRNIVHTEVVLEETVEGGYCELSVRLETLVDSLPVQNEIACFETQLRIFERYLDDMKEVANACATGNARDIEDFSTFGDIDDPCTAIFPASSEGTYRQELVARSNQRWLDAAVAALQPNNSTFTMLATDELHRRRFASVGETCRAGFYGAHP